MYECLCGCGGKVPHKPNTKPLFMSGVHRRWGTKKYTDEELLEIRKQRYPSKRKITDLNKTRYGNGKRTPIRTKEEDIIKAHPNLIKNKNPKWCWLCQKSSHVVKAHIIAVSNGGNHSPENLILLCENCHEIQHVWSLFNPRWNKQLQYVWFEMFERYPDLIIFQ